MSSFSTSEPIVTTTHGKVRGKLRKTVYDDEYYCFDGIPFAKPPLGELRFKAPQELEPWEGVRDCTETAPKCLQFNPYTDRIEGSEDCLFLNIYAKSLHTPKPLPVMVYIYGGMFKRGSASRLAWGPDYFMMKDVILITITYRCGPLGFLSLADPTLDIPGNAGLKDQLFALKWIKANCSFFNGDSNNITLFGHSAGCISAELLMFSPKSEGLFHKAILQSGYNLPLATAPNMPYLLAKDLGYIGENNDKEVYAFLMSISPEKLFNRNVIANNEKIPGYSYEFECCIEPYESEHSIIVKKPVELLQSTWSNKIPIIIGNTSKESLIDYNIFIRNPQILEHFQHHPEQILPSDIQLNCDKELQKEQVNKLVELHFGDKEISNENVLNYIDLRSYRDYYHPCHRVLLARRAKRSNAPTYLYRFDFDSPTFNLYRIKKCGPKIRGVAHVDELSYLFYMPESFKLSRDSAEFKTINRMIDMWTSFAASSNPNVSSIAPTVWEPLEREKLEIPHKCLNISHDVTFIEWPENKKNLVYNEIYKECKPVQTIWLQLATTVVVLTLVKDWYDWYQKH